MSTSDEDRQGDSLDQSRWDLKYYTMNPVVLWAHNYQGFPIGIVTDIEIKGNEAVATGKFAPAGINPEADIACALYQQKILRAVSPGYIQNDDGTRELLEVSFCPVPAGRYLFTGGSTSTVTAPSTRRSISPASSMTSISTRSTTTSRRAPAGACKTDSRPRSSFSIPSRSSRRRPRSEPSSIR
ncbi:MAG: hypothetical protein WBW84_15755 [Acidobacteriaceae bacterium]